MIDRAFIVDEPLRPLRSTAPRRLIKCRKREGVSLWIQQGSKFVFVRMMDVEAVECFASGLTPYSAVTGTRFPIWHVSIKERGRGWATFTTNTQTKARKIEKWMNRHAIRRWPEPMTWGGMR